MRQFMAALAALLVALPVAAQTQVVPYNGNYAAGSSGTLVNSGDAVTMAASGGQWATVVWSVVGTAGTARGTAEYSSDGGTNYVLAPSSKRIDAVTATPAITPLNVSLFVTGQIWETPLPGNTTHFRLRCPTSGTATSVQIIGGIPYVPNMPVIGVLYDISTTAGAANNTPTLDATGWREIVVSIVATTAVTGAASLNIVDDAGVAIAIGTSASIAIGTYTFGWGDSGTFGATNPFTMVGGVTQLPLDRRFAVLIAGATTSAARIRVVARR